MSVGAAPRDPARRRRWGDARARRRPSRDPARERAGGWGWAWGVPGAGRAGNHRPPTSASRLAGPDEHAAVTEPAARLRPPCSPAARVRDGNAWATLGTTPRPHRGSRRPHRGARTHRRAEGRTDPSARILAADSTQPSLPARSRLRAWRGGSSNQSGARGVRAGPMAARGWALLGDKVMGGRRGGPGCRAGRGASAVVDPGRGHPGRGYCRSSQRLPGFRRGAGGEPRRTPTHPTAPPWQPPGDGDEAQGRKGERTPGRWSSAEGRGAATWPAGSTGTPTWCGANKGSRCPASLGEGCGFSRAHPRVGAQLGPRALSPFRVISLLEWLPARRPEP